MSEYSFGKLVDNLKETSTRIEGIYDQLNGLNYFRKPAVHFKDIDTTIDEVRLGNSLLIKFLKLLFPTGSQEQILAIEREIFKINLLFYKMSHVS